MISFRKYADNELYFLFKNGKDKAFTEIYERYFDRVKSFLLRYLKSQELAEDVCQNVFIKLWQTRSQDFELRELSSFIFTIAKRNAIDYLRRASIEHTAMAVIYKEIDFLSVSVEAEYQEKEYNQFIEDVLNSLPPQSKRVFDLCRKDQKSYEEAAEILGISKNAVKKHMVRSIKALKVAAESETGISFFILLIYLNS